MEWRSVDGLARTALNRTVARGAALVRGLTISVGTLFVIVWHSWYAEHPLRLLAPVAVFAWDAAFCVRSWRRGLAHRLIAADILVAVLLAASGGLLVPGDTVGDGSNWPFVAIGVSIITVGAVLPATGWVPVSLVTAVTYGIGSQAVGPGGPAPGVPARSALTMVALCAVFAVAVTVQRQHADDADAQLSAIADRRQSDAAVEARNRDRREQERLLHDTILNTLTGIAWGAAVAGASDMVRARCMADVAELEGFLDAEPARSIPLWAMLQKVIAQATAQGLEVTLLDGAPAAGRRTNGGRYGPDLTDRGRAADDVAPATQRWVVRADLASAVTRAVGEALTNVARHAGTTRAQVVARRDPVGTEPTDGGPTGGTVTVTDAGRGFDQRLVAGDRLGVRRSVIERMADAGGTGIVDSAPGGGTTVTLRWER
ncbi:MAG: sensor histidine kinase [Frankia sp.]